MKYLNDIDQRVANNVRREQVNNKRRFKIIKHSVIPSDLKLTKDEKDFLRENKHKMKNACQAFRASVISRNRIRHHYNHNELLQDKIISYFFLIQTIHTIIIPFYVYPFCDLVILALDSKIYIIVQTYIIWTQSINQLIKEFMAMLCPYIFFLSNIFCFYTPQKNINRHYIKLFGIR